MKQFKLAFVLTMLMSMVGLQAFAAWDTTTKVQIDGCLYYYLDNNNSEAMVTSTPSGEYTGGIEIPSSFGINNSHNIKIYSVTSISGGAFYGCSSIYSVTIPNSVTSIGRGAFEGCSDLRSVTLNSNALVSKEYTDAQDVYNFFNIKNIFGDQVTKYVIGDDVTSIGKSAFSGCSGLRYLSIGSSVKSIGERAFYDCSSLTSITIGNSVTSIGDYAFSYCSGLTSVTIPGSVTSIGNEAFWYCSGLTSITIPNSVTSISSKSFSGCSGLTSMKVVSGNTKYDSRNNCNAIIETASNTLVFGCKNTIIPNSVTSIGENAFSGCSGLTSITIHKSVTRIGESAFRGCTGLTSVTVLRSTPVAITESVFTNRTNATLYVPKGSVSAYKAADYWKEFKEIVEFPNIVFADANVKAICIANWDANDDGELSEVEAAAVTSLGEVFGGNTMIKSFNELQYFTGLTSIGNYAFNGCSKLTSVRIPSSVTSISDSAFNDCSKLTSVTNLSETPQNISSSTFSNRTNATLHVPYGSSAAYEVADYWKDFKEIVELPAPSPAITFADANVKVLCVAKWDINDDGELSMGEAASVKSLGEVFGGNTMIKSFDELQYFTGLTSIGNYAFNGCSKLTSVRIPSSVTSIGNSAFFRCFGLTSITIPNSVTSIGDGAFSGCSGLTSVTIPKSVTSIGGGAFNICYGLTSMIVESGNTKYDSRDNCNAIIETSSNTLIAGCKNTIIPSSVTSIGGGAFYWCDRLTSVTIPNSVTSIGDNAFYKCSLTSVTIGSSVTSIGKYAFNWCDYLTSVTVLIPTPIAINYNVFTNRANATLYVPKGSLSAYKSADYWKEFKDIREIDPTEIDDVKIAEGTDTPVAYFDMNGREIPTLQKGMNIVKKANGQTVKVLVK